MVDLQERMRLFRSERVDNQQDFLKYADAQGYRDFVDFPDYALAVLFYAEHFKLRDAWIDAFAHCVGMNEKLILSPEFSVSNFLLSQDGRLECVCFRIIRSGIPEANQLELSHSCSIEIDELR